MRDMHSWVLSQKPGFLGELMALPPKHRDQVLKKIRLLETDPHTDGHTKKKLKHLGGKLHRLRSGDFPCPSTPTTTHMSVCLHCVDATTATYDDTVDVEFLGPGPTYEDLEFAVESASTGVSL